MKILSVTPLAIPAVKAIRFARFGDDRGWFAEPYRQSDIRQAAALPEMAGATALQANESVSRKNVVRGLHFQWNPYMGKLVRTLSGRMVDLALDIRPNSPTLGKAILHDMPARLEENWDEWIWVPPGFAHGNLFPEDTRIEYLCTGEYSPGNEAGICPFADDIDWTLADPALRAMLDACRAGGAIISEKDRNGLRLEQWLARPEADMFKL